MATLAAAHSQAILSGIGTQVQPSGGKRARGPVTQFVRDLIEDVLQKPLQPAHLAKHDMFREHIIAMTISYFALIIVLILASFAVTMYMLQ